MLDETTAKIQLAALLRKAAGVSAVTWVMSDGEVREEIHDRGARALVEAAGRSFTEWEVLAEDSKERSDVLLSGARVLGIATDWRGWDG